MPVKYGLCERRIVFGEPSGDAGSDFDPRRWDRREVCDI